MKVQRFTGGGYAKKKVLLTELDLEGEIVTVGNYGNGGGNGGTGGTGGTSSFGEHVSATGGQGSAGGINSVERNQNGAACGNGINGDLVIAGQTTNHGYFSRYQGSMFEMPQGGASYMATACACYANANQYGGGGGGVRSYEIIQQGQDTMDIKEL